jgi:hypothetical protein
MPFFSSDRERRLWIWALAAVAGIYSTLGLASVLAPALYHQSASAVVFLGCMLLVGLTILTKGRNARPGGVEIGVDTVETCDRSIGGGQRLSDRERAGGSTS